MNRLNILLILTSIFLMMIPAFAGAAQNQQNDQFKFPSINTRFDKTAASFDLNFGSVRRVKGKGYSEDVRTQLPFHILPISTREFTSSLIYNKFIATPSRAADRFADVTLKNYKEKVDLFLTLNRIGNDSESEELWHYSLGVAEKNGGKQFLIAQLIISNTGQLLYGNGNEFNEYWAPGNVKQTKDGTVVDIIDYRDGEVLETYIYRRDNHKLESYDEWPPGSAQDTRIEESKILDEEDKLLNVIYKKLLSASYANTTKKIAKENLVNAQRAWIKFRDANCAMEGELRGGAPSWKLAKSINCSTNMTNQRRKELEELFKDCCH